MQKNNEYNKLKSISFLNCKSFLMNTWNGILASEKCIMYNKVRQIYFTKVFCYYSLQMLDIAMFWIILIHSERTFSNKMFT